MQFTSEEDLTQTALISEDFQNCFSYPGWTKWEGREVEGLFGIPDVVFAFGKISSTGNKLFRSLAFEMKLKDWKRALVQAYRYSAFAHYSFVVLDETYAGAAVKNIEQFKRANIGLITLRKNQSVTCHYRPRFNSPYSCHTYRTLKNLLESELF